MRIKEISDKIIQLEKDIKDIEDSLEEVLNCNNFIEKAKESNRHIVKVLYKEYCRLTEIFAKVCVTEVYCGPDDAILPEVKRFFSEL